jgi:uncharacterized protein with ParB-like and HNH nuclease domain
MEATPTLVINYYSEFKQNAVPLFQRPYTWSEKQWRTLCLWDDVMVFYTADEADDKATHFMGAVVTMPARSVPAGVNKFLIIDGQQRLTTISILMCAVRDLPTTDQQTAHRRIQHFYLTNDGSEGTEFFKILPTQGDSRRVCGSRPEFRPHRRLAIQESLRLFQKTLAWRKRRGREDRPKAHPRHHREAADGRHD